MIRAMMQAPNNPRRRIYLGLQKVISGGQSGVDRAALDAALTASLAIGGWCPRGRWAEDGKIDVRYPLRPAPLIRPCCRTILNVRNSDGTLVLVRRRPKGGTALTTRALGSARPRIVVDPTMASSLRRTRWWLIRHQIVAWISAVPGRARTLKYTIWHYFSWMNFSKLLHIYQENVTARFNNKFQTFIK